MNCKEIKKLSIDSPANALEDDYQQVMHQIKIAAEDGQQWVYFHYNDYYNCVKYQSNWKPILARLRKDGFIAKKVWGAGYFVSWNGQRVCPASYTVWALALLFFGSLWIVFSCQ